jgi:hypothetical protein
MTPVAELTWRSVEMESGKKPFFTMGSASAKLKEPPPWPLVYRVTPEIPHESQNVSGTVVLHAVIDASGRAQQLEYVSGPPPLAQAAMDAVKWWQYRVDGKGEEVDTMIEVVFPPGDGR